MSVGYQLLGTHSVIAKSRHYLEILKLQLSLHANRTLLGLSELHEAMHSKKLYFALISVEMFSTSLDKYLIIYFVPM